MSRKTSTLYALPVRDVVSGGQELPVTGQTVSYAQGDDGYIEAGMQWPTPRFTDNGDGTVTDSLTGLMWLKDGGCFRNTWSSAFSTIANFNSNTAGYNCLGYSANYTDWRLPNVNELESLTNYGASNQPSWLNSQGFLNAKSSYYWSSTTYRGSTTQAWIVNMQNAGSAYIRKSYTYYAWPVREGRIQ